MLRDKAHDRQNETQGGYLGGVPVRKPKLSGLVVRAAFDNWTASIKFPAVVLRPQNSSGMREPITCGALAR
jgi:hypothetical protein